MITKLALSLSLFSLLTIPVVAQQPARYPTTDGKYSPGSTWMWLNPSGQAVPTSAANPVPVNCVIGCAGGGGGGGSVTQGTVPWVVSFGSTPTVNLGTLNGAALDSSLGPPGSTACATDTGSCSLNALEQRIAQRLTTINTTLSSPFQAGGSIGNSSFGISGTLPAFAVTPTVNLGTLNGAALASNQGTAGAAHTCSTGSSFTELSCLGQLDDDVKGTGTIQGNVNLTLTDCSGTITAGGTAQNAFAAQTTLHGFVIKNIDTSDNEFLWFNLTGTAAANTAASYALESPSGTTGSGGSFTTPIGMGTGHAVSVIAATTGHKFSCTWW